MTFDPDQERDEAGRWAGAGSNGVVSAHATKKEAHAAARRHINAGRPVFTWKVSDAKQHLKLSTGKLKLGDIPDDHYVVLR